MNQSDGGQLDGSTEAHTETEGAAVGRRWSPGRHSGRQRMCMETEGGGGSSKQVVQRMTVEVLCSFPAPTERRPLGTDDEECPLGGIRGRHPRTVSAQRSGEGQEEAKRGRSEAWLASLRGGGGNRASASIIINP